MSAGNTWTGSILTSWEIFSPLSHLTQWAVESILRITPEIKKSIIILKVHISCFKIYVSLNFTFLPVLPLLHHLGHPPFGPVDRDNKFLLRSHLKDHKIYNNHFKTFYLQGKCSNKVIIFHGGVHPPRPPPGKIIHF